MITGVILAGGLGRRMGGVDKGLQQLNGKPMVQWAIERFAPQVDELLINANQNAERYGAYGYPVPARRFARRFKSCHASAGRHRPVRLALPAARPDQPLVQRTRSQRRTICRGAHF